MKKALAIIALFIALIPYAHAAYYADLEINVDTNDIVEISGNTNYQQLLTEGTEQYVSKERGVRLLRIETNETFSDYIVRVNFPKATSINYVRTAGTFRIETSGGKLSMITVAQNKPISITAQYQIQRTGQTYLEYAIPLAIASLALYLAIKFRKRAKTAAKEEKTEPNLKGLSHRQKAIAKLLAERNKPMTQKEIEEGLKLPKASVSRNIRTLELKGIIEKEKVGMSNKIQLKRQ